MEFDDDLSVATDKARVTVYLPQDLKDRLTVVAEKDKRSVSVMIEILVLEALEAREQGNK
ncbi:ribbon-helix-helix domain-containing protein [Leptolyngbya ohadii]|uniref:ribbon-helix-helix domain-containing protein n=1 Tax=Leptolyngbya ohadii TaxID=1962290 RepID=UPI000B59E4AB|nr:ribbon-helix-helix protein, CopG family [Leptolyngbya ohadii]